MATSNRVDRPAPAVTDRLFFALRPDARAAARIHALAWQLRDSLGMKGMPLPAERLHVTLLFLGDHVGLPATLVDAANAAAKSQAIAPFDIAFNHVHSFATPHRRSPLVMGSDEAQGPMHALHTLLSSQLAQRGFTPTDTREYTPHVTLLHDELAIARLDIEPVSWRAGELLLVRSLIGKGRHEVIARYALAQRFSPSAPPAPSTSR